MPERPLSDRMREDVYAGDYREAVAALEAENARLRKVYEAAVGLHAQIDNRYPAPCPLCGGREIHTPRCPVAVLEDALSEARKACPTPRPT